MNKDLEEKAFLIVSEAFRGKVDKGGNPYLEHLVFVRNNVPDIEEFKVVALLHDLLEDCPEWTTERLEKLFPQSIVGAVVCLTKSKNQLSRRYMHTVKSNLIARVVKIADLKHNMDLSRLKVVTDLDKARLEKYKDQYEFLSKI